MGQRTAGDVTFESYLVEHGYDVPEHEPDLGIGVRVEYRLERAKHRCLIEVKEFAAESNPIKRSGSYSQEQTLKPIRGQIHQAARKLRNATARSGQAYLHARAGWRLGTERRVEARRGGSEQALVSNGDRADPQARSIHARETRSDC